MTTLSNSRLAASPFGMPSYGPLSPGPGNPFVTSRDLTNSARDYPSMAAAPSGAHPRAQTMLNSGGFAPSVDGQVSFPAGWPQAFGSTTVGGTPAYAAMPLSYTPPPTGTMPQMAPRVEPVASSLSAYSLRNPVIPSMGAIEVTGSSRNLGSGSAPVFPTSYGAPYGAPPASMGSVGKLDNSRISSMSPGNFGTMLPIPAVGASTTRSLNASNFGPLTRVAPVTIPSTGFQTVATGSRSPRTPNPFSMPQVSPTTVFTPQSVFEPQANWWDDETPLEHGWERQDDKVSESSEEFPPPPMQDDEDDYEQRIRRDPLQSRTGTDFAGEIPETAFAHFHAPQAHDLSRVQHRLQKAQEAHQLAQQELHEASMNHHQLQAHLHNYVLDPLPHNMRHVETDPERIYPHGAPVLKHGAGIQEVEPYPFWVGAGTPAARLEPTWIGGEWYLVAPVDFKGLANSERTHGFDKETQNAQLRVVDDAVHHLESQGLLPSFPPPRHWKEHKNCPIA